jgi:predicted dehydrogenase
MPPSSGVRAMAKSKKVGFVTMGAAGGGKAVKDIGIGMLGYAFMGKAHSNAYKKIAYMTWPPPLMPKLVAICGRNETAVAEAARRFGYESYTTDWKNLVRDDRIQLFDNGAPNDLHAAPTIAAAQAGKHVICEKPLGRDARESHQIWKKVDATGVKHMCAFNYRFVPAVRLAREMLEAGELGEIYHFRGRYLQEWITDPKFPRVWRLDRKTAGSGALGDLGTHVIDLARYLVGDISAVMGATRTFIKDRPGGAVDVDDAVEAVVEFKGGAVGTIEASRFCLGRKNGMTFEINGSKGSVAFDLERLNELQVHLVGSRPEAHAQGFRNVLVSEADHPFWQWWWPHGHMIGWEHTMVHELHHLLTCIAKNRSVAPHGATFEDGYRASEVADAILRSAGTGRRQPVTYR